MPKFGFYDYDKTVVGSDGVIYRHDLTSEPASGYTATGAGTNTFSSSGMTVDSAGTSGAQFSGISGQSALAIEGTVQFLISPDAFDRLINPITAAAENFINFKEGTTCNINKNNTGGYVRPVCSTFLDHKATGGLNHQYYGESHGLDLVDNLVWVTFTWDQCGLKFFKDFLKVYDVPWISSSLKPTFTQIILGAISTAGGSYTYKNLLISDKKTVIKPSTHRVKIINFYGDSYPQQGNYAQVDSSGRASTFNMSSSDETAGNAPYFTPDGRNGANFDASGGIGEAGMIPQCQKWLAKKGIFTHKIQMWGEGSSGYVTAGSVTGVDVEARVDVSLDGNYQIPHIAVVEAGYNDASAGASAAAVQTAAEGIIAALKAANSNIKIIMMTLPYNTNASYVPTLAQTQVVNTGITAAANGDSSVTLVDVYTLFGSETNDGTTNMSADFIHPDRAGQALIGRRQADAIVSAT